MLFCLWLSRESLEAITKFHDFYFYESIEELLLFTFLESMGDLFRTPPFSYDAYGVITEDKLPHFSWLEL